MQMHAITGRNTQHHSALLRCITGKKIFTWIRSIDYFLLVNTSHQVIRNGIPQISERIVGVSRTNLKSKSQVNSGKPRIPD